MSETDPLLKGLDVIFGAVAPAAFEAIATLFRKHESIRYRALRPIAGVPEVADAIRDLEAEATPVEVPGALAPQRAYEAFVATHAGETTLTWAALSPDSRERWSKIALAALGPSRTFLGRGTLGG